MFLALLFAFTNGISISRSVSASLLILGRIFIRWNWILGVVGEESEDDGSRHAGVHQECRPGNKNREIKIRGYKTQESKNRKILRGSSLRSSLFGLCPSFSFSISSSQS